MGKEFGGDSSTRIVRGLKRRALYIGWSFALRCVALFVWGCASGSWQTSGQSVRTCVADFVGGNDRKRNLIAGEI